MVEIEGSGPAGSGPAPAAPESGRRCRLDLVALVSGLVCLATAAMVLTGWVPSIGWTEVRWALIGAALLVGALVLVSSLRPRS